jgi:tripartite-type tricarboxylate transporter receptor subunit TctC
MTDLIAGHIPVVSTTLTTAAPQIRAGRARGLAISAASRLAEFPDIPTYGELGYPDLVATVWFSLSGPANVPADVVERLNAEVNRAFELAEVRERLNPEGIVPSRMSVKEFGAFVAEELRRWGPVVRTSGARND